MEKTEHETKTLDLKSHIEFQLKYDNATFLNMFGGDVAKELLKTAITMKLTTRAHKFDDGEDGEVADKLVIEIDFKDAVVQPHTHFEEEFGAAAAVTLEENINGLFENSDG